MKPTPPYLPRKQNRSTSGAATHNTTLNLLTRPTDPLSLGEKLATKTPTQIQNGIRRSIYNRNKTSGGAATFLILRRAGNKTQSEKPQSKKKMKQTEKGT
jgi:hypothetical protein